MAAIPRRGAVLTRELSGISGELTNAAVFIDGRQVGTGAFGDFEHEEIREPVPARGEYSGSFVIPFDFSRDVVAFFMRHASLYERRRYRYSPKWKRWRKERRAARRVN